jgi:hypothetical protein
MYAMTLVTALMLWRCNMDLQHSSKLNSVA